MRRYAAFVGIGLGYAFVPELTNLVLVNRQVPTFFAAQLAYVVILSGLYALHRALPPDRRPVFNSVVYMLVAGFVGLWIEWTFAGQSPSQNPDAVQWTMFAYWVGLAMIPRILTDAQPSTQALRRRLAIWYVAYWALHLVLSFSLPRAMLPVAAPILWTIAGTASFVAYFRYIQIYRRAPHPPSGHPLPPQRGEGRGEGQSIQ